MVPEVVFCPAAASGCRPCRPAAGGSRPCRPAAGGCRPCRPAAGGSRPCRPAAGGSRPCRPAVSGRRPSRPNPSVAFGDSSPFRDALIAPIVPPRKGEVPATWAVGFLNAESGSFNLWLLDSSKGCAVASACRLSLPGKTKTLRALMNGPQGRVRIRGSKWNRALPGGGSKWLSALPTGSQWESALPTCRLRP